MVRLWKFVLNLLLGPSQQSVSRCRMKNAVKSSGTPSPPRCGWVGEKYGTFKLIRLKTVLFQHGTRQDKLTDDNSCKPKVAQQQSHAIQEAEFKKKSAHKPAHSTFVVTLTPCRCSLPTTTVERCPSLPCSNSISRTRSKKKEYTRSKRRWHFIFQGTILYRYISASPHHAVFVLCILTSGLICITISTEEMPQDPELVCER